jgi:hypothetical protein
MEAIDIPVDFMESRPMNAVTAGRDVFGTDF